MNLKSYFANTVEDAMSMAREELGSEAMLVNSRKASPDARHLGASTSAGLLCSDMPVGAGEHDEPSLCADSPRARCRRVPIAWPKQMAELKKELEGMRRTITRSALAPEVREGT